MPKYCKQEIYNQRQGMDSQLHFWMILGKSQKKKIWNCLHLKNGDIKTLTWGFLCGSNKVLCMKAIYKL